MDKMKKMKKNHNDSQVEIKFLKSTTAVFFFYISETYIISSQPLEMKYFINFTLIGTELRNAV